MVSITRAQRIAERIREELSELLLYEISDPRLSGVSITEVSVDRELGFANVYVSALEGSERAKEILEGFHSAKSHLRHELALRIDLRTFPQLRFHWDPTFEQADKIERLIASLHEEPQPAAEAPEDDIGQPGEEQEADD